MVLAGSLGSLEQHCQNVRTHPLLGGVDIDFKLAPDSGPQGAGDERAVEETGFDHLSVRQCKVGALLASFAICLLPALSRLLNSPTVSASRPSISHSHVPRSSSH